MKPHPSITAKGASALIITLIFVTLLAIVIVGFSASMKLEVISANSHLKGMLAENYAQIGLDAGVARLQAAWNVIPASGYAASGPGWLVASTGSSVATGTAFDLSSGYASENASVDEAVNLNTSAPGSTQGAVAVTSSSMGIRWIYVLKDGTLSQESPPIYDAKNPAVGRFAFWTDDETAKINTNTAKTRDFSIASGDPSQINLETAFPGESANIANYRIANHYFDSPSDIRQVNTTVASSQQTNAFSLTHYSHAPNQSIFGESRIVLTTQKILADNSEFLDILATDNNDPGTVSSLDPAKLNTVIQRLSGFLRRTDWPFSPGKSFATKFSHIRPEQIAVNIIEYVRARESSRDLVEPIRGEVSGTGFALDTVNSSNSLVGNNRGVRITEAGFYLVNGSAPGRYRLQIVVELHLPKYAGLTSVDLSKLALAYNIYCNNSWIWIYWPYNTVPSGSTAIASIPPRTLDSTVVNGSLTLNAGEYRKVSVQSSYDLAFNSPYTAASLTKLYPTLALVLAPGTGARLDFITLPEYPILASGLMGPDTAINSLASDDPYNRSQSNWTVQAPGNVTWGAENANASTLGASSDTSPQQDTDANGLITDIGTQFPPPKGQTGNQNGIMESVAELGFIHTGYESQLTGSYYGPPWRTLRLQPKNDGTSTLPDWALLDIFRVPLSNSIFYNYPHKQAGGRININANIKPFSDTAGNSTILRPLPLQALLQGARSGNITNPIVSATNAQMLAGYILNRTLSDGGTNPGQNYGCEDFYFSTGQLAEIKGIADQGEASETLLRDIVDQSTTRGNVFTIYAIGQTINQTSSTHIQILGERRRLIMLEYDASAKNHWNTVFTARY